jgi:hypothetical protein
MATTKAVTGNDINQGSATVDVRLGGADSDISKTDSGLNPSIITNGETHLHTHRQYSSSNYDSKFDDYGLRRKTIEIGDWDMDSSQTATVAHGLSATDWLKIRSVEVMIRNDSGGTDTYYTDSTDTSANADDGIEIEKIDATNVTLKCAAATSTFDNTSFNETSYNRGWVTIWYE